MCSGQWHWPGARTRGTSQPWPLLQWLYAPAGNEHPRHAACWCNDMGAFWEPSLARKGWSEGRGGREGRRCCRAGSQGHILKDLPCYVMELGLHPVGTRESRKGFKVGRDHHQFCILEGPRGGLRKNGLRTGARLRLVSTRLGDTVQTGKRWWAEATIVGTAGWDRREKFQGAKLNSLGLWLSGQERREREAGGCGATPGSRKLRLKGRLWEKVMSSALHTPSFRCLRGT